MNEVKSANETFNKEALDYIDALFGYAMTLARNKADAEDLLQETYVRAARACRDLAPNSNLKSWMFVIMRNAWLNQLRHKNSGPAFIGFEDDEVASAGWQSDSENNPQVIYLRKIERNQVREAIRSLPLTYREVVVLRDIEGFSYQEIATALECPAGTVMSRLCRAREKLRQLLRSKQTKVRAKAV
jgi:RNA polymerase sigma-70 factor, ECF subfamily